MLAQEPSTSSTRDVRRASSPARRFAGLEIVSELGRGATGVVYLARQPTIDRLVALTVFRPGATANRRLIEISLMEARTASSLHHRGNLQLLDFGQIGGTFYLVTPYLPGGSLRGLLRSRTLSPPETAMVGSQIAGCLAAYHRAGLVHGNPRPSKILLDGVGMPFLAGGGLAELTGAVRREEPAPEGTPDVYRAPELADGGAPTPASDIYTLGATLYESLAGRPPAAGPHEPLPESVPAGLAEAITTALARAPEDRFAGAGELADAIVRSAACRPLTLPGTQLPPPPPPAAPPPADPPPVDPPPADLLPPSFPVPPRVAPTPRRGPGISLDPRLADQRRPKGGRAVPRRERPSGSPLGWIPRRAAVAIVAAACLVAVVAGALVGGTRLLPLMASAARGVHRPPAAARPAGQPASPQAPPRPAVWESLGGEGMGAAAVAARDPGHLDVFAIGSDHSLYHKTWDGRAWQPSQTAWDPLGGNLTGRPAVVARDPNHLDVFAVGGDLSIYHKWWDGSWHPSGSGWESLGGSAGGNPVAVSSAPGRMDVFVTGPDQSLYHKAWVSGSWQPAQGVWELLGGDRLGDPAAVSSGPSRVDVFAPGADHHVYHKWWDGAWHPSDTDVEPLGGEGLGGLVAASRAPNQLDVFAIGADHALYHKSWDGAWHPSTTGWESLGGNLTGEPAIASGPDWLDVFATGADRGVYVRRWVGRAGQPLPGWQALGPPGGDTGGGGAALAAGGSAANRLDVFALGGTGGIQHKPLDG